MTARSKDSVLRRLFLGHQAELRAALSSARSAIDHSTLKGDASEACWREMLNGHLPRRYRVTKGVVVDAKGGKSGQIDLIVHDAHYCPLFLDRDRTSFVPAESVYAVFEAKQEITAGYLLQAAEKVESVRRLVRTSHKIIDRGREMPPREPPPILGGIVGLGSGWKDGLGKRFREELARHTKRRSVDLGCALDAGAFEVPEGGWPADVRVSPATTALATFFVSLVRRLQKLGTVPAIDWSAYETAFDE